MFNRVVDDLMSWMEDVESQLMSEDHGKDLTSVNNLIKKHQVGRHNVGTSRTMFQITCACFMTLRAQIHDSIVSTFPNVDLNENNFPCTSCVKVSGNVSFKLLT